MNKLFHNINLFEFRYKSTVIRIIIPSLLIIPAIASAQLKLPNNSQLDAWEQFIIENGSNWKLRWNDQTGTQASLYGGKIKATGESFEPKKQISKFIDYYNCERLDSSLFYLCWMI